MRAVASCMTPLVLSSFEYHILGMSPAIFRTEQITDNIKKNIKNQGL